MIGPSHPTHTFRDTPLSVGDWQTFFVDLLCGSLAILWYILMSAENTLYCALTRIETIREPRSGSGYAPLGRHTSSEHITETSSSSRSAESTGCSVSHGLADIGQVEFEARVFF